MTPSHCPLLDRQPQVRVSAAALFWPSSGWLPFFRTFPRNTEWRGRTWQPITKLRHELASLATKSVQLAPTLTPEADF
eukprot:2373823-Amphidinium_carterae.1